MKAKDGGPAYPCSKVAGINYGMTLRDYFAGQALVGILAHQFSKMVASVPEGIRYDLAATDAYVLADAMIRVREEAN